MSGAAGLSAAKRRRGASQTPLPTSNTRAPVSNTPTQQPTQPTQLTPIKILENHELRLRRVEPRLENAFEGFEAHEKRLEEIENVLTSLIEKTSDGNTTTEKTAEVNITRDNTNVRLVELEKSLAELKLLLSKVQTFAMETNTALLKLSRDTTREPSYPYGNTLDEAIEEENDDENAESEDAREESNGVSLNISE